jgi:Uma2 family endonuclease
MNVHAHPRPLRPDLRPHADAVQPRLWRADELAAMVAAGIVSERDRLEVIGGEVVSMAAKGARHELLRNELVLFWARRLPLSLKFAEETPLRLSEYDEPEPDIILFASSLRVTDVRGPTALLVVEIADSSLSYDLKIKAPLYARFGVPEYWVIDAQSLITTVHRGPGDAGYSRADRVNPGTKLTPLAAAELAVDIGSLGMEPD